MKKKKEEAKKRAKDNKSNSRTIRSWLPASNDLEQLAQQLFKDYPEEHKAIHITKPSRKVAIDYMRVRCTLNTVYEMAAQTPENNVFLQIAKDGGIK